MTRARVRVGMAAGVVALLGYALTLAPDVTLWDSGELLAAAKGLGVPHPPGSPLFVLLAHVWSMVVPIGVFAWRVNLLAAVSGAVAAAFLAVTIHELFTQDSPSGVGAEVGAVLASLPATFGFTEWQNSNETEVYALAVAMIAIVLWLALRWRQHRGSARGSRTLLLIIYLLGLAVGGHLMVLLVGPAVVAFCAFTLRASSACDPSQRSAEWVEVGVVAGMWALLVGLGLGAGGPLAVGALLFAIAAWYAVWKGKGEFAALSVLLAAAGVSTYLFLLIRAGQHPAINEAQPDTWGRLFGAIGRSQYPVRTPFDDPTLPHGPTNPGRSLSIIWLQLVNYAQYLSWQWGAALANVPRAIVTTLFVSLGFFGARTQWRRDRGAFWLFAVLWLFSGLGLVAYMNFRPGFSLPTALYPDPADHEVRDRDYFFVMSFMVWGCWAGIQIATLVRRAWGAGGSWRGAATAIAAVAFIPVAANWSSATRRGPDGEIARDAAFDLLNSVGPYGILITGGDNDTFPLWYLQEVEGVRQDVTVVCLALANTDWYVRQLRGSKPGLFDAAAAPAIWRNAPAIPPDRPLLTMTDGEIARIAGRLLPVDRPDTLQLGPVTHILPAGLTLYPSEYVVLRLLQQNLGHRPVAWAVTTGHPFLGLDARVVLHGLAWEVMPVLPDTTDPRFGGGRTGGLLVDVPLTDTLLWSTFRFGDLVRTGTTGLDPASRGMAINLGLPFTYLAAVAQRRNDAATAFRNLEVADKLAPTPQLDGILDAVRRAAAK